MKIIVIICLLISSFQLKSQNSHTFSGFVYDKSSGEVLIGASIFDKKTMQGTISNEYGFYSLSILITDSTNIIVSYIGYQSVNINSDSIDKQQYDIYLTSGLSLKAVDILSSKESNDVSIPETGVVRIPIKDIKSLPNLFGEVDIIKAYQLTPGVQSGGEGKSDIYVRGGSPDQNLILLDDVPLYYISHFGGFFSIFNADAINSTKLIKGGFPARYGSRLSSVLDIRMKEGNMNKYIVNGTIGLLSSKISVEGPIVKKKLSFIVSARRSLLPIFTLVGSGVSYNFYDVNAKLNYKYSKRDRFFFSYYMGDDAIKVKEKSENTEHLNKLKWGNTLMSLKWNHVFSNKIFGNISISDTYYRHKSSVKYKISTDSINKELNSSLLSGINDFIIKTNINYIPNSIISFRIGSNSIFHYNIPNDEVFHQSGSSISTIDKTYNSSISSFENSLYLENKIKYKKFSANIGSRFSKYQVSSTSYYSFEPRIVLNINLFKHSALKYSYSTMSQYIHLLSYSGTGSPVDYWMPTTQDVKPELSQQNSLSFLQIFPKLKLELSLEVYYKQLQHLIAFSPGNSLQGNLKNWEQTIEKNGNGTNYGFEVFLQKKEGYTTGWVAVSLSKAERQFETINNSKPYPFKFDRLFDVSIVLNHKLKNNIIFSATWTYGSGYPITLANEHYFVNGNDIFVFGAKNSYRMRSFHRMDVAVNFPKKTKWGKRTWIISVFNVYNRKNPYYYYYDRENNIVQTNGGGDLHNEYSEIKLYQKSLFSIFPSIAYSFTFN